MKLVTTVQEILQAAQKDKTPKVRYQFQTTTGATCLFGGVVKAFGVVLPDPEVDANRRDRILDGFIDMPVEIRLRDIDDDEIRAAAIEKFGIYHNNPIPVGSLAMSLNDYTGADFSKERIATALLDAMTLDQIKTMVEIELN